MAKIHAQTPGSFPGGDDPVEVFRTPRLGRAVLRGRHPRPGRPSIGADRVLFGSDWPHAEGLADPSSFVDDLPGFADDDIRRIMRDNARAVDPPKPRPRLIGGPLRRTGGTRKPVTSRRFGGAGAGSLCHFVPGDLVHFQPVDRTVWLFVQ